MMQNTKQYLLGIDIGHHEIRAELFAVTDKGSHINSTPLYKIKEIPQPHLNDHVAQIESIIIRAAEEAKKQNGRLAGIGISAPATFTKDGVVRAGTDARFAAFNGVNLRKAYQNALASKYNAIASMNTAQADTYVLNKNVPIKIENRHNVMLASMFEDMKSPNAGEYKKDYFPPNAMNGKWVSAFLIGKRMGQASAQIDPNGKELHFVKKNLLEGLDVTIDNEDRETLRPALTPAAFDALSHNPAMSAKDAFSYETILKMAGVKHYKDINCTDPAHMAALAFAGKYFGRTLISLQQREQKKGEKGHIPYAYLLGGNVGSDNTGTIILKAATEELEKQEVKDIRLVRMHKKKEVPLAAACFALPQLERGR